MARERDSPLITALLFKMVAAIEAWLDEKGGKGKGEGEEGFFRGTNSMYCTLNTATIHIFILSKS